MKAGKKKKKKIGCETNALLIFLAADGNIAEDGQISSAHREAEQRNS